jgi:hypothetical protein
MATQADLDLESKLLSILQKTTLERERLSKAEVKHSLVVGKIRNAVVSEEKRISSSIQKIQEDRNKAVEKASGLKTQRGRDNRIIKFDKEHSKNIDELNDQLTAARDKLGKLDKLYASLSKTSAHYITNEREFQKALDYRIAQNDKIYDQMQRDLNLSDEQTAELKAQAKSAENLADIREDLARKSSKDFGPQKIYQEDIRKRVKDLPKEDATKFAKDKKQELGKEMSSNIKSLFSARGVMGKIAAARDISDTRSKSKALADELKEVGVNAKGAAGMFSMLGSAMGMLGKLGWVGLLLSAVQAIASAVNQSDKLIKGLNQSFMKMQGSTVGMKDVRKSMREFTNSVFDMNRNLQYGINSEQIMGLFDAMSAGGVSLQGVGKRIGGGYSEAIETAAKLSLDFGVELSEMGGMVSDQMVNMRSTISEVSDSFQQMSYDASIAGIKSQKFYEAISSATDALSFYGNYLANTSTLLKTFSEAGALGFKDASKEVQELTGMFSGMDSTKRMGFIQWSGVDEAKDLFKKQAALAASEEKAAADDMDRIDKEIAAAKVIGDGKKVESLLEMRAAKDEERRTKRRQKLDRQAAAEGSIMAMSAGLASISDKTMSMIQDGFEKKRLDIFDPENVVQMTKVLQNFGSVTEEAVRVYQSTLRSALADAEEINSVLEKGLETASGKAKDALKGLIDSYMKDIQGGKSIDRDQMVKDLQALKAAGLDFGMNIDEFMKQFEKNAHAASDAVNAAATGTKVTDPMKKKEVKALMALPAKIVGGEDAQKKVRTELVKNSMTFEKMVGIGKETLAYMAAEKISSFTNSMVNSAIIGTAESAKGILDFLTHPKAKSGEAREKDPVWQDAVALQERVVLLQEKQAGILKKKDEANKKAIKAEAEAGFKKDPKKDKARDDANAAYAAAQKEAENIAGEITTAKKYLSETINKGDYGALEGDISEAGAKKAQATQDERTADRERLATLEAEKDKKKINKKEIKALKEKLSHYKEDESFRIKSASLAGSLVSGSLLESTTGRQSATQEKPPEVVVPVEKTSERAASVIDAAKNAPHDMNVTKGGILSVRKGDLLVDYDSVAKGLYGNKGQFANQLLSGSGAQPGPVSFVVNVGGLHGVQDPEALVSKLEPAFRQLHARYNFEAKKRN